MRILFLTSRLPFPPNRGDRLRVFNFIRELSRRHQITLVSFIATEEETAQLAGLRPYCEDIQLVHLSRERSLASIAGRLWRPEPMQANYYRSHLMQNAISAVTKRTHFELVYSHLFRMAPYAAPIPHAHRIIDLTDVISAELDRARPYRSLPWRTLYRVETPRIRHYEQTVVGQFDETWVISENERSTLIANGARGNIQVVPNGIDSQRYHPAKRAEVRQNMLFVGHMGVPHNEDAAEFLAREIFPRVRSVKPDICLNLIGTEPSKRVKRLAALEGVHVLGHVPDLNAALNEAAVFVAPLRFAAGVQNKVLEAMAAGTPVVTTRIVNEGIRAHEGQHLLIGDTADTIAALAIDILDNKVQEAALSVAAREFVVANFKWDAVSQRVAELAKALQ